MLTIREPIKLKTGRPMQGIHQDMAERMQANYSLMNLSIRKEELLHITSQPAEIYFADSENFQVLTNINNQNQQEVRLEVINNLMNRILVAQTENFTYQDTVYISSILRKLGIRDEKTFMKQVFALQNEHRETRQLLQKYEENQELLQQLLKGEEPQKENNVTYQQVVTEQKPRYYIHDEIYHRLKTDKIYQNMHQFTKTNFHESSQIYPGEMQVAEQTKVAQNFLLQSIKNEVTGKVTPLYYLHNNRYEYLQEITEAMTLELEEQMTAAILLNLAEQSYILRQKQIEENHHYWYSIAKSIFQTSENTWRRYEANLLERKKYSNLMVQVLEEVNEARHLEGDTISNIVKEYYDYQRQWKEENEIQQSFLMQRNLQEDRHREVYFSGGSYYLTQDEFQVSFLDDEESKEENAERVITTEQLQKQLELYNQKNYENYQKITAIEKQQKHVKDRKVDRRKAQIDALRALEHPEEVLMEYITTENRDPVIEVAEKISTQMYELFSEETKEIYRQFLSQNTSENTTFLEHIMKQPKESEIRREVIQVLDQVERQEELVRTRREEAERITQQRYFNNRDIEEHVTKQLVLWKEIQEYPIVDLEEEIYLQNREKERVLIQETQLEQLKEEINTEKRSESAVIRQMNEKEEIQLTLLKEVQKDALIDVQEAEHLQESTEKIFQEQHMQYTQLRENVEKQIKRQREELNVVNANVRKEERRQYIELVHKTEEQLIKEELLNEIREQSQKTVKNTQTEETTMQNHREVRQMVQETVNRVQTNRVEDIEELVQQSVKRQLNHLSEQVYGKLEKKLQTERKRRGYF